MHREEVLGWIAQRAGVKVEAEGSTEEATNDGGGLHDTDTMREGREAVSQKQKIQSIFSGDTGVLGGGGEDDAPVTGPAVSTIAVSGAGEGVGGGGGNDEGVGLAMGVRAAEPIRSVGRDNVIDMTAE